VLQSGHASFLRERRFCASFSIVADLSGDVE
jgi:hypothetical protein